MTDRHNPLEEATKEVEVKAKESATVYIILPEGTGITNDRILQMSSKDALQLIANIAVQVALVND